MRLLFEDVFYTLENQFVLLRRAWDGGCFNGAFGGTQDGKLRLRHAFALDG